MVSVPMPVQGRGAWTKTAKLNGSIYYEYLSGKPLDGATTPTKDANFLAVNLGVKALQTEINARGYEPPLTADGVLGAKSAAGAKWVQAKLGLTPDGRIGSSTCKALWRRLIQEKSDLHGVDPKYIWGMMIQESTADPGAVGYFTPSDRGLVQINIVAHVNVTAEQAHDPAFAFDYAAKDFRTIWDKYSFKGVELQEAVSIANHNSPVSARSWYNTGAAPNSVIQGYVNKVLGYSSTW